MSHWIDSQAEEQRRWNDELKTFIQAGMAFIDELKRDVASDITVYNRHFPTERVTIQDIKNGFRVIHHSSVSIQVEVCFDPIRKGLIYRIPESENLSKYFPAEVRDGKLVIDFSQSGASRERLTSYILTPVLFPGLCSSDPGILGYLERQFGFDKR